MAGLYVHVPFCARACPYCDFDFEVGRRPDAEAFIRGLERELDARLHEAERDPAAAARAGGSDRPGSAEPRAAGRGPSLPVVQAHDPRDMPEAPGLKGHVVGAMSQSPGPVGHVAADRSRSPALEDPPPGPLRAAVPADAAWPTVYLGGGTPSVLGADGLRALGRWISRRFPGAGGEEYTVEVNPEHAGPALYAAVRAIGGTRVSLGVQTLDAVGLGVLGRAHAPGGAREAIAAAVRAGLAVSVDLIVGWPGQTPASLADDIAGLIDRGVVHVSIYALTVEPGTPWEALVRRGKRDVPDPEHQADMLLAAEAALVAAGLEHYEVASYAAPGHAARHNLGYWTWRDYLGLGPSAHSAVFAADGSVRRRGNRRGLAAWLADPATPGELDVREPLAAAAEGLWTGLRHLPGLALAPFLARFPAVDRAWLEQRTRRQLRLGNLELGEATLRVAPGRWLWHDTISADLLD